MEGRIEDGDPTGPSTGRAYAYKKIYGKLVDWIDRSRIGTVWMIQWTVHRDDVQRCHGLRDCGACHQRQVPHANKKSCACFSNTGHRTAGGCNPTTQGCDATCVGDQHTGFRTRARQHIWAPGGSGNDHVHNLGLPGVWSSTFTKGRFLVRQAHDFEMK